MGDESADVKPAGCLQKISHAIESRMNAFFSRLGELVAIHPGKTVLLSLVGKIIVAADVEGEEDGVVRREASRRIPINVVGHIVNRKRRVDMEKQVLVSRCSRNAHASANGKVSQYLYAQRL